MPSLNKEEAKEHVHELIDIAVGELSKTSYYKSWKKQPCEIYPLRLPNNKLTFLLDFTLPFKFEDVKYLERYDNITKLIYYLDQNEHWFEC